jgi:hypothetical protein
MFGHGWRVSRASLSPPIFNIRVGTIETRFEVGRDRFDSKRGARGFRTYQNSKSLTDLLVVLEIREGARQKPYNYTPETV